jgi:hypothetical protein
MSSSGMLRRVALVRTDVSEEHSTSIICVRRIGELGITLALTSNRRTLLRNTANVIPISPISCHPDDGGDMFLRNVGPYKSRTA